MKQWYALYVSIYSYQSVELATFSSLLMFYQGPVSLTIFARNSNLMQTSSYHYWPSERINFCKCPDCAVVSCAQFCSDHTVSESRWKFELWWKTVSEIGPRKTFADTISYYNDVIMGDMTSHITGLSIVCSTVCPGVDQRKHHNSATLTFVRVYKAPVVGKCFHLITSSSEERCTQFAIFRILMCLVIEWCYPHISYII